MGQESIADTLQKAIDRNRTAHAYLFCGTRGVGKTSMARIFARTLNRVEGDSDQGSVLRGDDIDVVEIDGASNNSVQDARDLIANASVLPARAPYKIYIIDEVHMLSTAAFNALLKTMEEPPAHVKFILCTTEPHKVLPTIQSRCQRFDFRPIPVPRIADHLRQVLASESVEAEDAAIARVARLANGSMRDGLSLLERLVAACDDRVDAALLERVLGVAPEDRVREAVAAIGSGDVAGALAATAGLLGEGLPPERVLDGFAERFRQLLVAATCGADTEVLETGPEEAAALAAEAARHSPEQIVHLIGLCDAAAQRVRTSSVPRAIVDAVVARMALSERFVEAAALLSSDAPTGGTKKKRLTAAEPRVRTSVPSPPSPDPTPSLAPEAEPAAESAPPSPSPSPPDPASTRRPSSDGPEAPATAPATREPEEQVYPEGAWARLENSAQSAPQRAMLAEFTFERLEGGTLYLRSPEVPSNAAEFVKRDPRSLEELAGRAFGRKIRVSFVEQPASAPAAPAAEAVKIATHPLVQDAMELFDAHVVQVNRVTGTQGSTDEPQPDRKDAD